MVAPMFRMKRSTYRHAIPKASPIPSPPASKHGPEIRPFRLESLSPQALSLWACGLLLKRFANSRDDLQDDLRLQTGQDFAASLYQATHPSYPTSTLSYWIIAGEIQAAQQAQSSPDESLEVVYLKYWTLNLRPLMVYPKVLFPPNFIIKAMHSPPPASLRALLTISHRMDHPLWWASWPLFTCSTRLRKIWNRVKEDASLSRASPSRITRSLLGPPPECHSNVTWMCHSGSSFF